VAEGALTCGPGAAHGRRPCRAVASLGLEPEPGLRLGTAPIGRPRLLASKRRGGGRWCVGGPLGREREERNNCWAGPHGGGRRKERTTGLGHAGREGEREKERESGPGPKRKRGRKRIAF
jgi:hypothetical protein